LVVLAAFMKVGKSTLVYDLLIAIAQGREFLGYPTERCPVLLLAVEEHPGDVGRRLRKFGLGPDDPVHVFAGRLDNSPANLAALREYIVKHQIRLMVVDTLSRFWTASEENDNREVVRQISPLLDMARETGCAIVLVHHEGKAGGQEGRGIRGGSALFALVDQALMLNRRQGGNTNQRILKALGRYAETPPELIIALDGGEHVALGKAEDLDWASQQAKVRGVLCEEPQGRRAIAEAAGLSLRATDEALKALGDEVVREGAGKKGDPHTFRLPGAPVGRRIHLEGRSRQDGIHVGRATGVADVAGRPDAIEDWP